jgi:hypothetical protein
MAAGEAAQYQLVTVLDLSCSAFFASAEARDARSASKFLVRERHRQRFNRSGRNVQSHRRASSRHHASTFISMATLVMAAHKSVVEFRPLTFQIFNIEMGPSIRVNLGCEEKQRGDIGAALETMARVAPRQGEKLARPGARVALPDQIGTMVIVEVKHGWSAFAA